MNLKLEVEYGGIPKESALGPFLFLIHILHIINEITNWTVSYFADDTQILLWIKDEDTQMQQNDLQKLYIW